MKKAKPPRLYWRERGSYSVWEIRDRKVVISTGTSDRKEAEAELKHYMQNPFRESSTANKVVTLFESSAEMNRLLGKALRGAKWRSQKREEDCKLTKGDLITLLKQQRGVCALTGMKFLGVKSETGRRMPFSPSIDRIDNSIGYEPGNVRIVLSIVNTAKGDYSDLEFISMCRAVSRFRTETKPTGESAKLLMELSK